MNRVLPILATIIAVLFLLYGFTRLLGAIPIIAYLQGWWQPGEPALGQIVDGINKVRNFLAQNEGLVPLGMMTYFLMSIPMGLALVFGGLAWLFKRRMVALAAIAIYLILWAFMFVNYGVTGVDSKLMQLAIAVSAWALLILVWRRRLGEKTASQT